MGGFLNERIEAGLARMKNCWRQYSSSITTKTANSCATGCQGPLLFPDQVKRVLTGIKNPFPPVWCR